MALHFEGTHSRVRIGLDTADILREGMLRQQSITTGWHNPFVVSIVQVPTKDTLKHIQRIQTFTIAWMSVEAGLSLWAAWTARSPALAAFGGDSAVELLSAVVVLWRFRPDATERGEQLAAHIAGSLLFALVVYVVLVSTTSLLGYSEPMPSYLGMAVLIVAAMIMPVLARKKRRLSALTGSATLRADATESALCAYLSMIALIGLAVHAIWHIAWADPVAALAITPLIVFEAREAIRGKACGCC
jgi:divalent metal cation (Fe/Co/Zn/Cd) transporter